MKFRDLHQVWKEALMLYEVYRRLGFTPDEIFMMIARTADASRALLHRQTKDGDLCICMNVVAQGLEYSGCVGPVPCAEDEIETQWKAAATLYNESKPNPADVERAWKKSLAATKLGSVALAMVDKGFSLPYRNKDLS